MSWEATAHVNNQRVSPTGEKITRSEKLLLLVLANYHNTAERCAWPSLTSLAQDAMLSRRQVIRLLSSLARKKFVVIEVGGFYRGGNIYRFIGLDVTGDKMSPVTGDILSPVTGDILSATSDISDTTSDIAMSPNPTIEPTIEPRKKISGADAPPRNVPQAPKKKSQARKSRDPRSNHPAIVAYHEACGRFPASHQYEQVIEALGTEPDGDLLRRCWREWAKRGYSPVSVCWATDWYTDPTRMQNGKPASRPNPAELNRGGTGKVVQ